jgi:adenylate cyclase
MSTRRLAAILAADVVGFSSMMERDEEGTLAEIKTLQREVIEPKVHDHHGRIVKTTGDGFLIEFASPVEAVRCAVAIQDASGSGSVPLRIGINLGDIIIEPDGDVYGDGVNIAARLEGIAHPGSICISGSVYDQVEGKIDRQFENRGEQQVKNIARPVRVYVLAGATQTGSSTGPKPLTISDKPSIAVLPFTNMSGDPGQEFFADGMTEDLITALSRLKWLLIIARNSTFTYKSRAVDVKQAARDLSVRYVLEGSVRTAGQRIRVSSQLIDAETGNHLWAEKYDRDISDIFALQDELTESVLGAIEPRLYAEESLKAIRQPPEKITSWGLVVRAIGLINRVGRTANEEGRDLLVQAIASEPSYARAHALLGWAVWWAAFNYWLPDEEAGVQTARKHAEAALVLDPNEPWARMVLGLCQSSAGQHDRALMELETALRLNPSFALAHAIYGWALARVGRYNAAVEETAKAIRLSPSDTYLSLYEFAHGIALMFAHRFEEALPFLRRANVAFPEFPTSHSVLSSCCGHLGRIEEAQDALVRRSALAGPPLTLAYLRHTLRNYVPGAIFIEGLAKAGVPET